MASWPFISSIVLLVLGFDGCVSGASEGPLCAYLWDDRVKISTIDSDDSLSSIGKIQPDNRTTRCFESTHYCHSFWEEDPNNSSELIMLYQGCWESSGPSTCQQSKCVGVKTAENDVAVNSSDAARSSASRKSIFCCCTGHLCNANVSVTISNVVDFHFADDAHAAAIPPVPPGEHTQHYVEHATYEKETLIIVLASVFVFAVIVAAALFAYRTWIVSNKPSPDSLHLMEATQTTTTPASPAFDIENLKLEEVVGRGRYGSVWKAKLDDHEVAVKIFGAQNRQYYLNECDIYTLPHMDHSSILKFFGNDERLNADGTYEYLLVMSYTSNGNLQDYLHNNAVNWTSLAKMIHSITCGLAHLHTDIHKANMLKPCISHRDLTTRNILVHADRACSICDFGFSMKISGSKYMFNGEEQHAETTSLTDVGTLRYMAPEVLEGAVNLRDCESSLKQIDVYSLGLVMWEVASRCSDLYQGLEVPEYMMPYEAEIGLHPSFEQMQVLVSRNKARPLFPEVWKDSNPAIRLLKETIEDCWDQDAEARLTALCVKERSAELPVLWDRHKANTSIPGVSPTVNLTSMQFNSTARSNSIGAASANHVNSVGTDHQNTAVHLRSGHINLLDANQPASNRVQNRSSSSTSENTVETTVTMSPSEPNAADVVTMLSNVGGSKLVNTYVTNVIKAPLHKVPLQPYQGRNPCIERNTMLESDDGDLADRNLLESGKKFNKDCNYSGFDADDVFDGLNFGESVESNTLVTNDSLQNRNASNVASNRPYMPIPYVQNTVVTPKQPNIPGNGHSIQNPVSCDRNVSKKKKRPFSLFEHFLPSADSSVAHGLFGFFGKKNKKEKTKEEKPLMKEQNVSANHHDPVETEVRLLSSPNNSQTVVRALPDGIKNDHSCNNNNEEDKLVEVGIAKLDNSLAAHEHRVVPTYNPDRLSGSHTLPRRSDRGAGDSGSTDDDSRETDNSCNPRRPTTLPLRGGRTRHAGEDVRMNGNVASKVTKRIKTPLKIGRDRFSLYDGRVANHATSLNNLHDNATVVKERSNVSASVPYIASEAGNSKSLRNDADPSTSTNRRSNGNVIAI